MSGSNYWGSLWGIVIIIFLFFFCVSVGVTILNFFYDRISPLQIWNSPVWLKLKIPLIILGILSFIAAVIAFARYTGRKELKAVQDYAQAKGWSFSRYDTEGLKAKVTEILSDYNFDLHYIRKVGAGERSIYLFDCQYKHKDASARSSYSNGTACLVQSGRFRPAGLPIEIVTRDWTEVMISDKVDMGDSLFAEKFLVLSKDPVAAKEIVNPSIQSIMLEHEQKPLYNPVSIIIGPGGAVVLTGSTLEHERLQNLLDLAHQIEAAME